MGRDEIQCRHNRNLADLRFYPGPLSDFGGGAFLMWLHKDNNMEKTQASSSIPLMSPLGLNMSLFRGCDAATESTRNSLDNK